LRFLPNRSHSIEIEKLQIGRGDDCALIHEQAFSNSWTSDEILRMLLDPAIQGDCAVERPSGETLGFVMSRLILDEAEILTISISAKYRGRKIGRELLRRHLSNLQILNIKQVFLEVAEDNTHALNLYLKLGFSRIGRREAYYRNSKGARIAAVTMRLGLI
jgi:[ribosomal protein S18]-alanine N-acetyltransferase